MNPSIGGTRGSGGTPVTNIVPFPRRGGALRSHLHISLVAVILVLVIVTVAALLLRLDTWVVDSGDVPVHASGMTPKEAQILHMHRGRGDQPPSGVGRKFNHPTDDIFE